MSERTRQLVVPLVAFLFGVIALGVAAVLTLTPQGRDVTAASVGGPFRLVTHDGRDVSERDFLGAPHLVFFGFTHCPDICPTKLFEISQILEATGERGRNLRALFISVDPERDTPALLKSYTGSFDERIVGLTGSPEQVDAAVKAYRAYYKKVPTSGGDYTMEHTAVVYLMDRQGRFVGLFDTARPADVAARELVGLL